MIMEKKTSPWNRYWPWIIFFIALGLRFLLLHRFNFALGWERGGFPHSDAREWDVLAMNILQGRGFGDYLFGFKYQSFICPFYPLFLAFIYSFFGHNYMAVKLVQLLLSSLNAVVIYAIGRRLFSKPIGVIAGLITACYLPYMFWVSSLMRETFFIFVLACAYLALLRAMDEPLKKNLILAGVCIGITILTRPGGLILLPLIVIAGLTKRNFKTASLILIFSLLTVLPWLTRSMVIHQGGIILEASGARHFWTGANPEYGGSFYERSAWQKTLWDKPFAREMERYKRLNQEGVKFIKENPQRYFKYFQRRTHFFWRLKRLKIIRFDLQSIERWLPYLIIWLGVIGAVHSFYFFSFQRSLGLVSLILLYGLGAGIYGGVARYRMPIEQFFIIFTAYTIYGLSQIHRKEWRRMQGARGVQGARGAQIRGAQIRGADVSLQSTPHHHPFLKFLTLCGLALVLIFSVRLCVAYWGPGEKIIGPEVDKKEIHLALKKHNLFEVWEKQIPRRISYRDVFLDQAANSGYLKKYNHYLVVWKGRMDYIIKNEEGNIKNFRLTLNPSPHSFGQEDFEIFPAKGIRIKAERFKEGDIIFVIARIRTTGQPLYDPRIDFYEILGGG